MTLGGPSDTALGITGRPFALMHQAEKSTFYSGKTIFENDPSTGSSTLPIAKRRPKRLRLPLPKVFYDPAVSR